MFEEEDVQQAATTSDNLVCHALLHLRLRRHPMQQVGGLDRGLWQALLGPRLRVEG